MSNLRLKTTKCLILYLRVVALSGRSSRLLRLPYRPLIFETGGHMATVSLTGKSAQWNRPRLLTQIGCFVRVDSGFRCATCACRGWSALQTATCPGYGYSCRRQQYWRLLPTDHVLAYCSKDWVQLVNQSCCVDVLVLLLGCCLHIVDTGDPSKGLESVG